MIENKLVAKQLQKYYEVSQLTTEQIFASLTLYIYSLQNKKNDLYILAKLLPEEYITAIISYFDGDFLQIPTKEDYQNSRLLALTFFLKEIQKWSWNEIKDFLNINKDDKELFSTISLGKQINSIKEDLNIDIKNLLTNLDQQDIDKLLKGFICNEE